MIKRPLHKRFSRPVKAEEKTTTIRKTAWPVGVSIMLYHWRGKPYHSKHEDVAEIVVNETTPITIEHLPSGQLLYTFAGYENGPAIWCTEGFADGSDMDDWFRPLVKRGQQIERVLMSFQLVKFSPMNNKAAQGDQLTPLVRPDAAGWWAWYEGSEMLEPSEDRDYALQHHIPRMILIAVASSALVLFRNYQPTPTPCSSQYQSIQKPKSHARSRPTKAAT